MNTHEIDFDDNCVKDYLARSSARRKAEILQREYVLRRRSDETAGKARSVLAVIQGVYRALRKRGKKVAHVEWVYSKFDESLRYHLDMDYVGLTYPLDKEHDAEVLSAVSAFEGFAFRTNEGAKPSSIFGLDPRANAKPGEASQGKKEDKGDGTLSKHTVFG